MSSPTVLRRLSSSLGLKLKSVAPAKICFNSRSKAPVNSNYSSNRVFKVARLPVETWCLLTMMPLHSAIATARLQSVLSVDSRSWCLVPHGMSMPL